MYNADATTNNSLQKFDNKEVNCCLEETKPPVSEDIFYLESEISEEDDAKEFYSYLPIIHFSLKFSFELRASSFVSKYHQNIIKPPSFLIS
jgi:hypothetical protein